MKADHDFSAGILLCRWLVAAALFCFSLSGQAVTWNNKTDFLWSAGTGNITTFPGPGTGQMIWDQGTKTPTSGGPKWTGAPKQLPFNPSPTARFSATFSPGSMARALFSPTTIITWAAADALQRLMTEACVRVAGGSMQLASGGQWEECHFTTGTQEMWSYYFNSTVNSGTGDAGYKYTSGDAACTAGYEHFLTTQSSCTYYGQPCTWVKTYNAPYQCVATRNGTTSYTITLGMKPITTQTQDGWQSTTSAAAESKITAKMNDWTQADFSYGYQPKDGKGLDDVLDSIINSGNGVELDPSSVSVTGTPQIVGAPKVETTQNPDGTTTTKTTTVTNNYTYGPSSADNRITITHNTTTSTSVSVVNNSTNQTIQTSTTTVTEDEKEPDERCMEGDTTAGCADLDIPTEKIPRTTKNLTYTAESVLGGGSCPADKFLTLSGGQSVKVWDWVQSCDYIVTYVKPVILAAAAFIALIIIMPGGVAKGVET